jgi:hypothetical protein
MQDQDDDCDLVDENNRWQAARQQPARRSIYAAGSRWLLLQHHERNPGVNSHKQSRPARKPCRPAQVSHVEDKKKAIFHGCIVLTQTDVEESAGDENCACS